MPSKKNGAPETVTSRIEIGFNDLKEKWPQAEAEYDDYGSLKILGHPVMEKWETNYMAALANVACKNGGTILELGFGLGISASMIQRHRIEKHVIIEANYDIFSELLKFSRDAPNQVIAIQGFWENCVKHLAPNSFDGILFDTYPLTESEIHKNHFAFFPYGYKLLKTGGIMTYYSDEKESLQADHLEMLRASGFNNIDYEICELETPDACQYWQDKTMVIPIIQK